MRPPCLNDLRRSLTIVDLFAPRTLDRGKVSVNSDSLIPRPVSRYGSKGIALSTLSTAFLAVMPKCPLCWLALMGTLGVGSIVSPQWMQPLAISLLLLPISVFLLCAYRTHRYGPLYLALGASVAMYLCKFHLNFAAGMYLSGMAMLGAGIWSAVVTRQANKSSVAKCGC